MRMRFTTAVVSLAVGAAVWGAPVALADQAPGGPHHPSTSQARDIPIVTGLLQGLGLAPLPVAVPVVPTVPSTTVGAGGSASAGGSVTVPGAGVPAVPVVPVPTVPTVAAPTLPTVAAPTLPSVPVVPSVPPVSGGAGASGSVGSSGADAGGDISAQ